MRNTNIEPQGYKSLGEGLALPKQIISLRMNEAQLLP
jgi:hypothetical protein